MDEEPISYLALKIGTPVQSSSGTEVGTVEHVLQVPAEDLFDGIVVKMHHGLRFVDRDQIATITTASVQCSLSDDEVAALPAPSEPGSFHVDASQDEGSSLSARLGRMFGREHWIADK
jgi:hypothetical protein